MASAAVLMTACQSENPEAGTDNVTPEGQTPAAEAFRLVAETVSVTSGTGETPAVSSKTSFSPADGSVEWDADDELSVIVSDNGKCEGYRFVKSDEGDGVFLAVGEFSVTETAALNVIYPYAEEQNDIVDGNANVPILISGTCTQAGVSSGAHIDAPMYGYTDEFVMGEGEATVKMNHASALFEVMVTNGLPAALEVAKITVTNSAEAAMSGDFLINPQTGRLTATDKVSDEVSLTVTGGSIAAGETESFYLSTAPFTLEGGSTVTVTVTSADGTEYESVKEVPAGGKSFEAGKWYYREMPVEPNTFDLDRTEVTFDFEATPDPSQVTLSAVEMPEGATSLTWTSSDEYVVKVEDGVLTPVGHGVATVTATADDPRLCTAVCTVKVKGVKDLNYGKGDTYYDKLYFPVNIEVVNGEGETVTQTWLDRNLGASQVATAYNDYLAYGSSFQWSRKADGHEQVNWTSSKYANKRNYGTTEDLATDRENAGSAYILTKGTSVSDWAADADSDTDGLWGGGHQHGGIDPGFVAPLDDVLQENNPCPAGYRIPSSDELYFLVGTLLDTELTPNKTFEVSDALNILADSDLHITAAGYGNNATCGLMAEAGTSVRLWCNTTATETTKARCVIVRENVISTVPDSRARGYSVRCIRDTPLETVSLD